MEGRCEAQNSAQPLSVLDLVPPRVPDRNREHGMGVRLHGGLRTPALLHAGFVLLDARGGLPALPLPRQGHRDAHPSLSAEGDAFCMGCVSEAKAFISLDSYYAAELNFLLHY
ncbi:hypothetical protein AVEN_225115-1 [Araneus ventricosus]|uniref:Uncharacterized protein n=1 Tax=Araneus ventricosus TaxID=182803 RepID=A0A4Y2QTP4_ARAVE|nr:hypothetical protein AVEN_225115-1 [Araneus ventricosus]